MLLIYEPTERANPTEMLTHSYLAELMNPTGTASATSASAAGLSTGSAKVGSDGVTADGAVASGPMEVASGADAANVVGGEVEVGGTRR
jgi:hypothetical protein